MKVSKVKKWYRQTISVDKSEDIWKINITGSDVKLEHFRNSKTYNLLREKGVLMHTKTEHQGEMFEPSKALEDNIDFQTALIQKVQNRPKQLQILQQILGEM